MIRTLNNMYVTFLRDPVFTDRVFQAVSENLENGFSHGFTVERSFFHGKSGTDIRPYTIGDVKCAFDSRYDASSKDFFSDGGCGDDERGTFNALYVTIDGKIDTQKPRIDLDMELLHEKRKKLENLGVHGMSPVLMVGYFTPDLKKVCFLSLQESFNVLIPNDVHEQEKVRVRNRVINGIHEVFMNTSIDNLVESAEVLRRGGLYNVTVTRVQDVKGVGFVDQSKAWFTFSDDYTIK